MHKLIFTLSLAILSATNAFSQDTTAADDLQWGDFIDMMDESDSDGASMDADWTDELYAIYTNPYDINEVTADELKELPFVTSSQADAIVAYVMAHGPVVSLGELMMIDCLTERDRMMLRLFLKVGDHKKGGMKSNDVKHGRHEAVWRTDVPLYSKAGFKEVDKAVLAKNPNKVYIGDKYKHAFRYSFDAGKHLKAGLMAEKDAGETGIDYRAGYVMLKDCGMVKNAVIGCFRANYGLGLTVSTSSSFGKSMAQGNMDKMDLGVNKYSGTGEWGYFNGATVTLRMKKWEVSAYGSLRHADGTFRSDSTGITAFKTDGLHRTVLERSKKGNVSITDMGANIHWGHANLMLSASVALTHLDVPLYPSFDTKATLYRKYMARGQDFAVGSVSFLWKKGKVTTSGEWAFSNTQYQSGMAGIGSLQWDMDGNNRLALIGRYYGARFVSINGKAFGGSARPQNEEGLFASWSSRMLRNVQLNVYADLMYSPWLKYGVSSSAYACECAAQATYSRSKHTSISFRYKMKAKQKDMKTTDGDKNDGEDGSSAGKQNASMTILGWDVSHNAKMTVNHRLSPCLTARANVAAVLRTSEAAAAEKGFAMGANVRWKKPSGKAWVDLGTTGFFTDSYNARVYAYEASLPYSFGSTSYFYKGMRATLAASIPLAGRHVTLNAKIGSTVYFDRDAIGTGLDRIDATHREDVQVQMKWAF